MNPFKAPEDWQTAALAFAREGAALIGVHYSANADAANATVRDIEALGVKAVAVRADLRQGKDARQPLEAVWRSRAFRDGLVRP